MLDWVSFAGRYAWSDGFNFHHPHIKNGEETDFLLRAFRRDFQVNGPSVIRIIRTVLMGWRRYKHHPDPRIRARFAQRPRTFRSSMPVCSGQRDEPIATMHVGRSDDRNTRRDSSRVWLEITADDADCRTSHLSLARREERRLADGWTYEPPTYYESNQPAESPQAVHVQGVLAECVRAPRHRI